MPRRRIGGKSGKYPPFSHKGASPYRWLTAMEIEDAATVWGPRIRFKVTRLEPPPPHYLFTLRAKEFYLQDLLDSFGGGTYYVRAFDGRSYVQSFRLYLDTTTPSKG